MKLIKFGKENSIVLSTTFYFENIHKKITKLFRVNLHRTSFFRDLWSQPKEEERKGKIYGSFKLNQKQLHYLGKGLTFVHH